MTSIVVTCQTCGASFYVDVDEEGMKLIGEERLKRMARCDKCVDLQRSKERSEHFARKEPKNANEPF